jgi:hypothetical protein
MIAGLRPGGTLFANLTRCPEFFQGPLKPPISNRRRAQSLTETTKPQVGSSVEKASNPRTLFLCGTCSAVTRRRSFSGDHHHHRHGRHRRWGPGCSIRNSWERCVGCRLRSWPRTEPQPCCRQRSAPRHEVVRWPAPVPHSTPRYDSQTRKRNDRIEDANSANA